MTAGLLRRAAAEMRDQHGPEHVQHGFWGRVADWLDREAARASSHAITVYKVEREGPDIPLGGLYAYSCITCGVSGSSCRETVTAWQDAHANMVLEPDDAAVAVASSYLYAQEASQ